jgi:DNA modification methylase
VEHVGTPYAHWKNRIEGHGAEPPENLLANPLNWRVHPSFQQEAVRAALDEIGWIQQVVVNQVTGHVIDGHLRVALAISKGEAQVPVTYVKLSPDEERLALATFDPLGSLAVADDDLLQELLRDVRPFVVNEHLDKLLADLARGDLVPVGATRDLDDLVGEEKAPTPGLSRQGGEEADEVGQTVEATPGLVEKWGVREGQTWHLPSVTTPGAFHTLHVGDCLTVPVATLPREAVLVTSPPYGMGQDYEAGFADTRPVAHRGKGDRGSRDRKGGRPTEEGIAAWLSLMERFAARWSGLVAAACINLADHTVAPTPGLGRHTYGDLVSIAQVCGWELAATRVWHKGPVWGNNAYWLASYKPVPEYEFVGLFLRPGEFPFKPVSERVPQDEDWRFRSVWEFPSVPSQQADKGHHPTAFPAELPRRCILLLTDPGTIVVDPFLGSGTTMVAAEGLGRVCLGVERDPAYAAMALERMARMGVAPELMSRSGGASEAVPVAV